MKRLILQVIIIFAVIMASGCSGNGTADPVTPSDNNIANGGNPTVDDIERMMAGYGPADPSDDPAWDCERYFTGEGTVKLTGVEVGTDQVGIDLKDDDCGGWNSNIELVFNFTTYKNFNHSLTGTKTKVPFVGSIYTGSDEFSMDLGFFSFNQTWLTLLKEKEATDPDTGVKYQNLKGYLIKNVSWAIKWNGKEYEGFFIWNADVDTAESE